MDYQIEIDYRSNDELRHSFNELAKETFGLSFESWYQSGYWDDDKYIPYSIVIDNKVVSNVSVNIIDCKLNGKLRHYIQLGTVMTKKGERNKGYCRILIQAIMRDHIECDGFFLYANDSVLGFYPKFGFKAMPDYRFCADVTGNSYDRAEPVSMRSEQDWAHFLKEKAQRQSNGILQLDTDGLLMFYLTQSMHNDVYYIRELDTYVIAEIDNDTIILYDVFSTQSVDMAAVYHSFGNTIKKVKFAFIPRETTMLKKYEHEEDDTTFFVCGDNLIQDMKTILSFPEIVHA